MMKMSFLRILIVFVGWTFTSFACHFCAKLFLKETEPFAAGLSFHVIILTGLQLIMCLAFTHVHDESDTDATTKYVFIAHTCETLTTNWSMSVTYAASTFAIKLMEPLTSAILQRFLFDIRLSYLQWISIPAVVYGAILFTEDDKTNYSHVLNGVILAFISNICLSLRNIYIKKNATYAFHNVPFCLGILVSLSVIVVFLQSVQALPPITTYIYGLLIGSALFHVGYSYIFRGIVLKDFSDVGHVFGNILKEFSVLGFLYMTESRTASAWNSMGLFICVIGMALFILSKTYGTEHTIDKKDFVTTFTDALRRRKSLYIVCISAATVVIMFLANYNKIGINGLTFDHKINVMTYNRNLPLQKPLNFSIDDFFSVDLVQNPEEAGKLSPLLTKRPDVIKEAQRIHQNIFTSLLGRYKYAMLFDYASFENKGDSAVSVGEFIILRKLKVEVIFTCPITCSKQQLNSALNISKNYTDKELILLFHGGDNVIGSPDGDYRRSDVIQRFMRFEIVMFPQSILYGGWQPHINFCTLLYAQHPRLTFVWRDKYSYILGKRIFPHVRSLLSPDITYQIGFVPRFMHPIYDILWMNRSNKKTPLFPKGIRVNVSDWLKWKTPSGANQMEDTFLMTTNGMTFLQRGRIVITDRLHGHILSTLLGIPHVFIDTKEGQISNYHNTWTAGIENIILANSSFDAVAKARQLLIKLDEDLPEIKAIYPNSIK